VEEEVEEPEPAKPIKTKEGTTVTPKPQEQTQDSITMSSKWQDARMHPYNPIKTQNWNANWGQGEFTCIHTMNDKDGPWWKADFGAEVTITKV